MSSHYRWFSPHPFPQMPCNTLDIVPSLKLKFSLPLPIYIYILVTHRLFCRVTDLWSEGCLLIAGRSGREFFSSEVTVPANSISILVPTPPPLPQWHVKDPGYTANGKKDVGVGWLCCPDIVSEPIRKRAHMQLFRECSANFISARWATMSWSWPKKWNWRPQANVHFKTKQKKSGQGMIC